jgi:hypothetical protein
MVIDGRVSGTPSHRQTKDELSDFGNGRAATASTILAPPSSEVRKLRRELAKTVQAAARAPSGRTRS